jgi:hypothetical protein
MVGCAINTYLEREVLYIEGHKAIPLSAHGGHELAGGFAVEHMASGTRFQQKAHL